MDSCVLGFHICTGPLVGEKLYTYIVQQKANIHMIITLTVLVCRHCICKALYTHFSLFNIIFYFPVSITGLGGLSVSMLEIMFVKNKSEVPIVSIAHKQMI